MVDGEEGKAGAPLAAGNDDTTMPIPKTVHQVWVGSVPRPVRWMQTWPKLNPGWEYRVWGNGELHGGGWRNQALIDHYVRGMREAERTGEFTNATGTRFTGEKAVLFATHVLADVMRYEILLDHGGFMPGADTECLAPIPEDAFEGAEIYMVNTGYLYADHLARLMAKLADGGLSPEDAVRLRRYDRLACAPVMACAKGHPFVAECVAELGKVRPEDAGEAVDTTGNVFMARMIRAHADKLHGFVMRPYIKERESVESGAWRIHRSGTTFNRYRYAR
jgi:hypothetical protein